MTLTDHVDIELILIEASAYNLRNEVQFCAKQLITQDNQLSVLDAYVLALEQTISSFNI